MTTPTDVETPAKDFLYHPQKVVNQQNQQHLTTGEKPILPSNQKKGNSTANGLISGLYYAHVKQIQKCQNSKEKLRIVIQDSENSLINEEKSFAKQHQQMLNNYIE